MYHGTNWYVRTTYVYVYHGTKWYTTMIAWYLKNNLKYKHKHYQKGLEIQALRCNGETSGPCQRRRHHGTIFGILRFQLDSDVCSADLHHNPRKHACGFHGWSSWLGTCSPGSGAVRASVRFTMVRTLCHSTIGTMVLNKSTFYLVLSTSQ